MSPHCDPELEDSKPILVHDTLAHDVASPYQVWSQKVQQLRWYRPDEHSLEFWTFPVIMTLTTTEQSYLFTRQSTLWWCAIKQSLVAKGSAVCIKNSYFNYIIRNCDLDLEDSKPIFLKDNLAHNDASSYSLVVKSSAFQTISSGQTFTHILTFCCDLDLEHNDQTSP